MYSKYKLDTCVWEITHSCNFNCAYCGSKAGQASPNELSINKCIDIAKQLIDMKCRRVVLIGGEVFLKDNWEKLVSILVENNIDCSIITNGFLINDEIIKILENTGIKHICISIDGDKAIHDEFRVNGSFDRAINAIRLLKENNFVVSVITTLNSKNISTIESLYKKLKKLNIDAWQLQSCSPFGNASDKKYLIPNKKQLQGICEFVAVENQNSPFQIAVADNIGYHSDLECKIRGKSCSEFSGCSAGINTIGIDSVGNVRGCESLYDDEFIEGNLQNELLYSIWSSQNNFLYNRSFNKQNLKGKCFKCEVWYKCAAGCRSFNYFCNGEMYEAPLCLK